MQCWSYLVAWDLCNNVWVPCLLTLPLCFLAQVLSGFRWVRFSELPGHYKRYHFSTSKNPERKSSVVTIQAATHRPLSSSFLGLPYRILNMIHKKELLRGLWVCYSNHTTVKTPARTGVEFKVSREPGMSSKPLGVIH